MLNQANQVSVEPTSTLESDERGNRGSQKSRCPGYCNEGQLSNGYIPEVGAALEEAAKANLLRECVLDLFLQPSTAVSELLA